MQHTYIVLKNVIINGFLKSLLKRIYYKPTAVFNFISFQKINLFQNLPSQPSVPNNQSPKKSIKTKRAPKAPDPKLDLDAILPYEEATREHQQEKEEVKQIKPAAITEKWNSLMSVQQKQITAEIKQVISEGTHRGLQKVQSFNNNSNINNKKDEDVLGKLRDISGDILTKVTIPRSGSFLNAGGLTRYKSKVSR